MRTKQTILKHRPMSQPSAYVLSIKVPTDLIAALDQEAQLQCRTRASLIRQTLSDRYRAPIKDAVNS